MDIKAMAMGFIGFVIRGVILIFLILGVYRAGEKAYDFGYRIFTEEPMTPAPGRDVSVTIVQGDSVMDVGEMFEEKGLIRDAKLFFVQKKCSVYDGDIKPGFYTLNTSMTAEDMFGIIAGKEGEEPGELEDDDISEAPALTEAKPLEIQTGDGDWEGAEEIDINIENIDSPEAPEGGDDLEIVVSE